MTTYAIVQTGGKQYQVQPGDTIRVESLPQGEGEKVELSDVRMVSNDGDVTLGTPTVSGATVTAEVAGHGRGKKVVVFKYKAKTRYRRKQGHRQSYTELTVTGITLRRPRKES
jgi:large subunit ribosomal protein L21